MNLKMEGFSTLRILIFFQLVRYKDSVIHAAWNIRETRLSTYAQQMMNNRMWKESLQASGFKLQA